MTFPHEKSAGGVSPTLLLGIGTGVLAVGTGVMAYLTHTKGSDYDDELHKVTTEAKCRGIQTASVTTRRDMFVRKVQLPHEPHHFLYIDRTTTAIYT